MTKPQPVKTVTIEEVENETIDFEIGLWVFIAKDLTSLLTKLRDMFRRVPRTLFKR